jgi:Rrf2 family protein
MSMDRWIAISDGARSALHALAYASARGGFVSAHCAAEALGLSPTYLAKLLQDLSKKGLVDIARGASGGFAVKGDPKDLSCLDVLVAIDGPAPELHCLFAEAICDSGTCKIKLLCDEVATRSLSALRETTVADLAQSFSQ